jgi:hypothetical protein
MVDLRSKGLVLLTAQASAKERARGLPRLPRRAIEAFQNGGRARPQPPSAVGIGTDDDPHIERVWVAAWAFE